MFADVTVCSRDELRGIFACCKGWWHSSTIVGLSSRTIMLVFSSEGGKEEGS